VIRVVGVLSALLAVAVGASTAAAQAAEGAATAVSCPATVAELTPAQADAVFSLASRKLAAASKGPLGRYPFGALNGATEYQRTGPSGWTSGFFPGELWLLFDRTKQSRWLDLAREWTNGVLPMARFRGSHDLGFMVGIPTSLGFALEPGATTRAAYAPQVRAIKSSDYGGKWGVIIDSAMNAPMLIEAGERLGGAEGDRLKAIGIGHMRTLARDFIRPDGSTYHRLAYDPRTGDLLGPIPGQGLNSRTSTWARGQAWAIAGFSQAYERTGDPVFLDAALRTSITWMEHVPAGCVPAWDFDLANSAAPRDSSAVAIAASGMLHLADAIEARVPGAVPSPGASPDPSSSPSSSSSSAPSSALTRSQVLRGYALKALGTLANPSWTTENSANPGILLRQTHSVPAEPREGSYVWGDYYLLDALSRAADLRARAASPN